MIKMILKGTIIRWVILLSMSLMAHGANFLKAQSTVKIVGRVTDVETGELLVGANVVVEGTGYGAVTDESGTYLIENLFAGEYSLRASYIGYETLRHENVLVHQDGTTTIHFQIRRIFVPVGEIVIEAERKTGQSPDFVERLSSEDIKRSDARTVGELLEIVPGIDIIDEGGGSGRKRVTIRGGRSNHVTVLLDGVALNDPLLGDVDLSLIPVSTVKEIRIIKSGSSPSYGSAGLGGIIDIVTKSKPVDDIGCGITFGDFQSFGFSPSFSGTLKRLSYLGQYDHLKNEGKYEFEYVKGDSEIVRTTRRNADFSSRNFFGNIVLQTGGHEVTIKGNVYDSERGLPGLIFALTPYARAETNRRIFLLDHRFSGHRWQWQINLSRHDTNTEYRHLPPADAPLQDRSQPPYHSLYELSSHQGRLQVDWYTSWIEKLGFNMTVRRDELEDRDLLWPGTARIGRATNTTYGLALQVERHFSLPLSQLQLRVASSLRYDAIDFRREEKIRTDNKLSPRLGLLLSKVQGYVVTVKANWGRSFRAPTFADLFYEDFQVRGNPDVNAESSENFDIGIRFGIPIQGWFEMETNFFRRDIDDLIVWRMGSFATFSPFNTDAFISGWELDFQWKFLDDRMRFYLNHVILEPLNKSGLRTTHDRWLPYQSDHTTKLGVNLNVKHFSLDYRRRMIGERYVTEANTVQLEPYAVDDISVMLSNGLKGGDVRLKLSIRNIFDAKYEMIERAPLPGRHWRGGVEVSF